MKHSELSIFKDNGQKITCLTAYDASMARLIDSAGVDIILLALTDIEQNAEVRITKHFRI